LTTSHWIAIKTKPKNEKVERTRGQKIIITRYNSGNITLLTRLCSLVNLTPQMMSLMSISRIEIDLCVSETKEGWIEGS